MPYDPDLKLISFDINNMYINIPTGELTNVIKQLCKHKTLDQKAHRELTRICNLVPSQNYFQYRDNQYIQTNGLAMGAPTSSIFSEIFLQYLENTKNFDILKNHKIIGYFRYVDNILMVYKENKTSIHEVSEAFNDKSPTLQFTTEMEYNNKINFLDITIQKSQQNFLISIYRKPTATDAIIPNGSWHPYEHKIATIRFLANCIITYLMNDENKRGEYLIAKQILANNQYDGKILDNTIDKFTKTKRKREPEEQIQENTTTIKWAKFTYMGTQTKFITKLFKKTNIKIAYTMENTIKKNFLTRIKDNNSNKYKKRGVYQLTCQTCNKKYIGQVGSSFQKRFQEHLNDFKNGHGIRNSHSTF